MPHLLAYIDPGSGSLIIQAAIAAVIAIPIFLRAQIARILPGRRSARDGEQAPVDDGTTRG